MGKAIPYDFRVRIIKKIESGQSYQETAEEFGYSESGVKKIWYAFQKEGESSLVPKYANCGRKSPYKKEIRDRVDKIRDNQQGGTYVYSKLKEKYAEEPIPSVRTLTRWWKKEQTHRPKGRPREKEKKNWSIIPHHTWQIDGKELVQLSSGQKVSWMNIGDEATAAHLKAKVYETDRVSKICPKAATRNINQSFMDWGMPQAIKIDNGRPFIIPNSADVPTLTVFWWVGLGIKVIQNTPCRPQENGIVECLQGTMSSWSNPKNQPDSQSLQQRLDEESDFQRNHYRMPARKYKSRIEIYPELEKNTRKYDPNLFQMKRVYEYLSKKVWKRIVKKTGQVSLFGKPVYIGNHYAGEEVTITFDPLEKQWLFRKFDGTLLKTSKRQVPEKQEIIDFATMSKN